MKRFVVCLLTLLMLALASVGIAADRIEHSTLNFIYSNSTLNTYTYNASTPIYVPAEKWCELTLFTNSSSAVNSVQVEQLVDFADGTTYDVGTTPSNWLYTNGGLTSTGSLDVSKGVGIRWVPIAADNSTGAGTGKVFYAAASGAASAPQKFFSPVGGWYHVRVVGWSAGDYADTYSANATNATLRVRKP